MTLLDKIYVCLMILTIIFMIAMILLTNQALIGKSKAYWFFGIGSVVLIVIDAIIAVIR